MDSSIVSPNKTDCFEDLTWDGLLERCKEKDEQLNLAGTYGLELQKQLSDAYEHIEKLRSQHEAELETHLQENFELKGRLDAKERILVSQNIELEEIHKNHDLQKTAAIEEAETTLKKEISDLKKDKECLNKELEQAYLKHQHIVDLNQSLEERCSELQNEVTKLRERPEKIVNDSFDRNEEMCILQDQVDKYSLRVKDLQNKNHEIQLELTAKTNEAESNQREIEEVEAKATSYFNHLQIAREESTELRVELESLKQEIHNQGHKQKGNSLFGEVEDKRKEMEKKLKSFQIKFESLSKAYSFLMNQNQSMKAQIAALLQMNSGKADVERITHLERALSQANAEIKSLSAKNKENEKNQDVKGEDFKQLAKCLPDFESNRHMIDFLVIELESNKEKLAKIIEENDHLSLMKIAESEKLMKSEQKLYETDLLAEKFRNENLKLRLKVEDMKNKVETEKQRRLMVEKKFNYDSKDDIVPLGVLNESKSSQKARPIPPTFAKMMEKQNATKINENKYKFRDIDTKLNLKQSFSNEKENVFVKHVSSSDVPEKIVKHVSSSDGPEKLVDNTSKTRKVSFRNETELIPELKSDENNTDKNTEKYAQKCGGSLSHTPVNNIEKKSSLASALKKKENLQAVKTMSTTVTPLAERNVNTAAYDVSDNVNDNPDCKMQ